VDQHRRDLGLVDAVFAQGGAQPITAIAPRAVSTRIANSSLMKQ
jgi:hypothetical protein